LVGWLVGAFSEISKKTGVSVRVMREIDFPLGRLRPPPLAGRAVLFFSLFLIKKIKSSNAAVVGGVSSRNHGTTGRPIFAVGIANAQNNKRVWGVKGSPGSGFVVSTGGGICFWWWCWLAVN
jgi:hypothetical protein